MTRTEDALPTPIAVAGAAMRCMVASCVLASLVACKSQADRDREDDDFPALAELRAKVDRLIAIEADAGQRAAAGVTAPRLPETGPSACLYIDPPKNSSGGPSRPLSKLGYECRSIAKDRPGNVRSDEIAACNEIRWAVVIKPRELTPPAVDVGKTFRPGSLEYDALVYSFADGSHVGGVALRATNSPQVDVRIGYGWQIRSCWICRRTPAPRPSRRSGSRRRAEPPRASVAPAAMARSISEMRRERGGMRPGSKRSSIEGVDGLGRWARALAPLVLLLGCGPGASDDDVYPKNCGVEGPVDLFESSPPAYLWAGRAGEHYLIEHSPDDATLESWAVDRCGERRVLLATTAAVHGSPSLGVAGDWILSCDEATGAMSLVDPNGVDADRMLFESVESCRVVLVGNGLAAQQRGGSTVWFHPDPSDPDERAVVVTDAARIADPDWILGCWHEFTCDSDHPFGIDIRTAGDELLVVLQTEELLAFSPSSLSSRIADPGPVFAIDVLDDGRRLVVDHDLGPTLVIERSTGASFEFCCFDDLSPIRQLGDWLVKGWSGAPTIPEPPEWTTFRARHLISGQTNEVVGRDSWDPLARLTADTIVVEIAGEEGADRYAVWPATAERRRLDLPDGDVVWTLPGEDGLFMEAEDRVIHLADPDASPRTVIDDADIVFPTRRGRIVFEAPRESGPTPVPLRVALPDGGIVEIEPRSIGAMGVFYWGGEWPVDRDEVVYVAEDGPRWILRRTVLP